MLIMYNYYVNSIRLDYLCSLLHILFYSVRNYKAQLLLFKFKNIPHLINLNNNNNKYYNKKIKFYMIIYHQRVFKQMNFYLFI